MKTKHQDLVTLQAMPTGGASDRTLKSNVEHFTAHKLESASLVTLHAMPTGGGSDRTLKKNVHPIGHTDPFYTKKEVHVFPLLVNVVKRHHAATQKNRGILDKLRADTQKAERQLTQLQKQS